jgi:Fe-S-cluster containining protein
MSDLTVGVCYVCGSACDNDECWTRTYKRIEELEEIVNHQSKSIISSQDDYIKRIKELEKENEKWKLGYCNHLDLNYKSDLAELMTKHKKLVEEIEIYRSYLTKNGYGLQLHDIDKLLKECE